MKPIFIDTHTHLYDAQFTEVIDTVINNAIQDGVQQMLLPNCDSTTIAPMLELCAKYPTACHPMMGLHPVYVRENYVEELAIMEKYLGLKQLIAIGEIGLDFYWDKTFIEEQYEAFKTQIHWAKSLKLPISIHTRDSIDEGIQVIETLQQGDITGVFHCFSGNLTQAQRIVDTGFLLGIGGVSTFKNCDIRTFLKSIPIENIILETDAPYLAPVPFRGKRNESKYIPLIAQELSNIYQIDIETIAQITTANATRLFYLKN